MNCLWNRVHHLFLFYEGLQALNWNYSELNKRYDIGLRTRKTHTCTHSDTSSIVLESDAYRVCRLHLFEFEFS